MKVQVKRTGRNIIRAQVKRDKEKLQIRVKDRVTNHLYVYLPAQIKRKGTQPEKPVA